MAAQERKMEISFDRPTIRRIDNLTSAIEKHTKVVENASRRATFAAAGRDDHVCEDYHDENTLFHVRDALGQAGVHNPTHAITMMQNAGILFRERKQD